jgi:hypothetical protein
LLKNKILSESLKKEPYKRTLNHNKNTSGMPNIDWRLPLTVNSKKTSLRLILWALYYLTYVHLFINLVGFNYIICKIKKSRFVKIKNSQPYRIELLKNSLNKACKVFPIKTKCLEWAVTFCMTASKNRCPVNLVIGVQNYPFMAHAWVESNGKIIGDDSRLRENLAIILEEPYRH